MHKVYYTQEVKNNLKEIQNYIALDDPIKANEVIDSIISFINVNLSIFPIVGVEINIETNLRMVVEQKYID